MSRETLAKAQRIVIKLGTKVLTDRGNALSRDVLGSIVQQTCALVREGRQLVIVTSGAIASGLPRMGLTARPKEINLLQAAAALGQSRLMHAYEAEFEAEAVETAQILITLDDVQNRARYLNIRNTILALWDVRAVPVVNENDTVSFAEILRFGDNDVLGAHLANMMDADLYILLTDTDGLYTGNPKTDRDVRFISEVETVDDEILARAHGKGSELSSGGMEAKLRAARIATTAGVGVVIANGKSPEIGRIAHGEAVGTYFHPRRQRIRGRKKWIAFNPRVAGQIVVDAGGARAISVQRRSLLPAGVTGVRGEFPMGANVAVVSESGSEIARGLTNFSSEEIRKIKGMHSSKVAQVLETDHTFEEIVHRDNMVVRQEAEQ
jgi:glutamate 5-kinase